jgi:hypothetical protein
MTYNADATTDTFDDGLTAIAPIANLAMGNYSLDIAYYNNSADVVYIKGYIDFNNDGDFLDAGEKSSNTLSNTVAGSGTLTFSGYAYVPATTLKIRLRLSSRLADVDRPNGPAVDGEVEDYVKIVVGSVGNYVWNDSNGNGINDEGGTGINGVTVELWNATTNTLVSSTATANNASSNAGYYNFVITANGNYYIKFPTTNGAKILTNQTTTADTDNNSDANISTGSSPTFTININGTGIARDNMTIDAGYICAPACIPITITKTN